MILIYFIALFICITCLYMLSSILYIFKQLGIKEEDMINYYKNQWRDRK